MWFTLIIRWSVLVLMLVAIAIALGPAIATWMAGTIKPQTSGDPVEIRLVGVAPDGDNILLDADHGRPIPGMKLDWPGQRTLSWPPQHLQRDLLFELGPEARTLQFIPGSARESNDRGMVSISSIALGRERVTTLDGHPQLLISLTLNEKYWKRNAFFGSSQRQLEQVDFDLKFYGKQRGWAQFNFDGPFVVGRTNHPREKTPVFVTVITNDARSPIASAQFRAWWAGPGTWGEQIFIFDKDGKRYLAENGSSTGTPLGWTNDFTVAGLPLSNVAGITIGEQPRVKTFNNILVRYPDRLQPAYSPVLDRLAAAIGQSSTNLPARDITHQRPRNAREALTILEFIPTSTTAMSFLAHSDASSDLSLLSATQKESLRQLATGWANKTELYDRQLGLRMGLRGGWPEFTSLALDRLTNGAPGERLESASSLAAHTNRLGPEHLPMLVDIARTNSVPGFGPDLVLVILRIGGPAATNALLELAHGEDPIIWWSALVRLNLNLFSPMTAQTDEMQQRLWMVTKTTNAEFAPAIVAAGKTRLAKMLTIDLRMLNYSVFEQVFQAVTTKLDRRTATDVMLNYLHGGPTVDWRCNHPAEIIRQLNDWYGKDLGGLGGVQTPGRKYPEYDAWPGIVEDVLDFGKKLKGDEKTNP